ncbi:MAG: DUF1576 domain-containing protein, partial [Clostridiales bacterium]|nr:DUF1576 domain-containing protein [Clostridiales bacterium]
ACLVAEIFGLDFNGPVIGGIFTIIGFGAFGKHIKNIYPVMGGAILAACFNTEPHASGSNSLAILFSTALAPIAGQFGPIAGFICGFLHVLLVSSVGSLHQGLNLYNNGYAAGFIALIVVPIISALRKDISDEF